MEKKGFSGEVTRKTEGKRAHVDVGVESPHERLIPLVFDNVGPTQMIDGVCQILDPIFCLPRPELGVEIRFRER